MLAYLLAFLATFLWSTAATAFYYSLSSYNVYTVLFIAVSTSFSLLFSLILFQNKLVLAYRCFNKNISTYIILAILNPVLYYSLLFYAYSLLPPSQALALNYTWPLALTLLSIPLLKQRISLVQMSLCFLGYIGSLMIASGKGSLFEFSSLSGTFIALLSAFIWALYWIFNHKLKDDALISLFIEFAIALPFLVILYYFFGMPLSFELSLWSSVYIGLTEMGFAFLFWLLALKHSKQTSHINHLAFLAPFLSLYFLSVFTNDDIVLNTYIGLIIIIISILLQSFYISFNKK